MTAFEADVAAQAENDAPKVDVDEATIAASEADTARSTAPSTTGIRLPASLASLSSIPRLFKGSGLRKPSKIPRLSKQQSSVASTMDHFPDSQTTKASVVASSAVSVASAVSSRETTPFNSPTRLASRLREPKQVVSRKRSRDEMTSNTIASVAERLLMQERQQMQHSEELTLSSQTTLDDATSMGSAREDESEPVEDEEQRREQELTVAKALQRDLLRDRARLRLKISALKDDVEVYYELLARMEQAVLAIRGQSEENSASLKVSDRILAIISAKRDEHTAGGVSFEDDETSGAGHDGDSGESGSMAANCVVQDNEGVCGVEKQDEEEVEEH